MKLKFLKDFDDKRKRGHEVEVDRIKISPVYVGYFAVRVRVVGEWGTPRWMSMTWFVKVPEEK